MANPAREASSSRERWLPEVLPEHTIFLSHSGHDKPFVERLCEELKRVNYSPFFDQNSDGLPKGERFPPHIFKAAEQCLLAVIVLSEGYLTSKWPMLELVAFVKAKETRNPTMKLLPLFYKLPPSDLVPGKWIESWEKLAEDGKIHAKEIELWSKGVKVLMEAKNVETERAKSLIQHDEQDAIVPGDFSKLLDEAVQDLRPFNGLEFSKYGASEGRFIQVVVDEICEIIPPVMKYDTDLIRGYQRICKKVSSLFEEGPLRNGVRKPVCESGRSYLGIYGMGGIGKTTLCVAMCSFFQAEFRGRVCHVELGSDTQNERMERLKHVIRELGGCDSRVLRRITGESQGLQFLQERLRSQPPAFLAVDGVGNSQSSRDEAQRFISCGLACGSKVMVTSRSRLILKSVLGEAKYCKPIPGLEYQEAEELFLSVASPQKMLPLRPSEEEIVEACIRECKFFDDGHDTQQYHPLALRAMGTFFHDLDKDDTMEWEEALMYEKKLRASRESINDILGRNYATLSDGQKLFFLDVVFVFNSKNSSMLRKRHRRKWEDDYNWAISLIAVMHRISNFEAELKVKNLQQKSLVSESGRYLKVHDLYIEFAQSMVAMEGSKENEWWVGFRDSNGFNPVVKRLLLFKDASKIFQPPKHFVHCPNLECLIMHNCEVTLNPKLDLKRFPNLRLLIVTDYVSAFNVDPAQNKLEIFYGSKDENEGCLLELQRVQLLGFNLRRLPFLRHCCNLTYLSIDACGFDKLDFPPDGTPLFENLKAIETLLLSSTRFCRFPSCLFDKILHGAAKLKNLKCLEIDLQWSEVDGDDFCKLDLSPLGRLTSFQTLSLPNLPSCIEELIGLDQLSQLIELNLQESQGLRQLPNLDLLPKLLRICVDFCGSLHYPENQLKRFRGFH